MPLLCTFFCRLHLRKTLYNPTLRRVPDRFTPLLPICPCPALFFYEVSHGTPPYHRAVGQCRGEPRCGLKPFVRRAGSGRSGGSGGDGSVFRCSFRNRGSLYGRGPCRHGPLVHGDPDGRRGRAWMRSGDGRGGGAARKLRLHRSCGCFAPGMAASVRRCRCPPRRRAWSRSTWSRTAICSGSAPWP